jgi:hypothetical protein
VKNWSRNKPKTIARAVRKQEMMIRHRHLDQGPPTAFDRRITLAQILTYSVARGHIPSCKHQILDFYITALVEHFKFSSEKIDEKYFEFQKNFSLKN